MRMYIFERGKEKAAKFNIVWCVDYQPLTFKVSSVRVHSGGDDGLSKKLRLEETNVGKIKIFTDSTSDLSPELLQIHEIGVVPVLVTFGEESYKDGVEITTRELYKRVDEGGKLPKTAAPSPGDFVKAFCPHIEAGDDILYIALSSGLSSTYQSGLMAAAEFPEGRIECVDSLNLSTGIGLVVMKAVDFVKAGMGLQEIAKRLREEIVPKVETEFVIDTLEYLHKGGRCSGMQNLIGSMLKIRPVVKVVNGKMILAEKIRGKRERVLQTMLEHALADKDRMEPSRVFVTHSMGEEDAKVLKSELEKHLHVKEILITEAGCVISSHCGPNTVGILYVTQ